MRSFYDFDKGLEKFCRRYVNIDRFAAENKLGFQPHDNLKDFYFRVLGEKICK